MVAEDHHPCEAVPADGGGDEEDEGGNFCRLVQKNPYQVAESSFVDDGDQKDPGG